MFSYTISPEVATFIKDFCIPLLTILLSTSIAYSVVRRAINDELKKGRVLLQTFAQRYFISFQDCFDTATGHIRNYELSKSQHMAELEAILMDFSVLTTNAFYQKLIEETPRLIECQVAARRELMEHKHNSNFALNIDTAKDFAKLYRESRKSKHKRLPIEDVIEKVEAKDAQ